MTGHYYDHRFRPWTEQDGVRVVADEGEWDGPISWSQEHGQKRHEIERHARNGPMACNPDQAESLAAELSKPRILVDVDLFEPYDGEYRNSAGHWVTAFGGGYREALKTDDHLATAKVVSDAFTLTDSTPNLTWLTKTRYPERVWECWPEPMSGPNKGKYLRKNLWLGVGPIHTQADADKLIPDLLKCRDLSPCLWVEIDPRETIVFDTLLHGGPPRWLTGETDHNDPSLDWVVIKGTTEPIHPDWVRGIIQQCESAGVPVWFDSWGEWTPRLKTIGKAKIQGADSIAYRVGPSNSGRLLDGKEYTCLPPTN